MAGLQKRDSLPQIPTVKETHTSFSRGGKETWHAISTGQDVGGIRSATRKRETWHARKPKMRVAGLEKKETWRAVYLAVHLLRKERQEALSRWPAAAQPGHGR